MGDKLLWASLRIGLGWILLWPFLDKTFGLGFDTAPDKSWLAGVSPTYGFLKYATKGPFVDFFHNLAGSKIVEILFMLGLLLIGLALILGILIKIAAYSGASMLFLMWLSLLFPEHNPFLDEHIIYAILLIALTKVKLIKNIAKIDATS